MKMKLISKVVTTPLGMKVKKKRTCGFIHPIFGNRRYRPLYEKRKAMPPCHGDVRAASFCYVH